MELEFDKEIDSLLSKTGEGGRGVLVGDKPGGKPKIHLDVDQLAAFAENALPEKPRALYMSHLADCDRCRRILSGLIALNAEAEPAEERIAAPAISPASVEPWYRRFLLPNLAYVMGGLVLVFGGLIAISVLRSPDLQEATVSQALDSAPAARGPMFESGTVSTDEISANSNTNSAVANTTAAKAANAAANAASVVSNTTVATESDADRLRKESLPQDQRGITLDGVDAAKPTADVPAAPPPPVTVPTPAPKGETITDVTAAAAESKDDDAKKARVAEKRKVEDLELNARQVQELPRTQAGGKAKSTPGPSRDAQQNFPNRANNTYDLYEERRISGKGFQRKNNVWYDNSYRGQATINVRRGTDDYRKLDRGLRTIAESLNGVVIVMWSGKAYRIQ